jgi:hypothetical protein
MYYLLETLTYVIPAEAGIYKNKCLKVDSRFRGNDLVRGDSLVLFAGDNKIIV